MDLSPSAIASLIAQLQSLLPVQDPNNRPGNGQNPVVSAASRGSAATLLSVARGRKTRFKRVIGGRFVISAPILLGSAWHFSVTDLAGGKRRRVSSREAERANAEITICQMMERAIHEEKNPSIVPINFQDAYNAFLKKKDDIRASTRATYVLASRVYEEHFHGKKVHEVTSGDVEGLLQALRDKGRTPRTRSFHLMHLKGMFAFAVKQKFCRTNPCDGIDPPKVRRKNFPVLNVEQARKLLQETKKTEHLYLATAISLLSGSRRGTALRWKWGDVDLKEGIVRIDKSRMKNDENWEAPLNPELWNLLRERYDVLGGSERVDGESRVIGLVCSSINTSWRKATERVGLPKFGFHGLRRSFATFLDPLCSFACLKALMSHSLTTDVSLLYIKTPMEERRAALAKMPSLL